MPAELATSLTVTDEDLLLQAEQQVRDYCGWHIAPERTETLTLDGSGTGVLLLPSLRVADIAAMTEDGEAVDLTTIEWSAAGIVRRDYPCWTAKYQGVTVNLTHGLAAIPADVTGVVRDIANRAKSTGGLKAKTVGPFSETYAVDHPDEKAILDRYKLPPRP